MKAEYKQWLEQRYPSSVVDIQMYRAGRVERFHGDFDEHYSKDMLSNLIEMLTYSTEDERNDRPNPSKIPYDGNNRKNLAAYKRSVVLYGKFRNNDDSEIDVVELIQNNNEADEDIIEQRIGLERDMQMALRRDITQLESGMIITDGGLEKCVNSGRIDITAQDASKNTVVIELKAGLANQRAIAQILSYMGDLQLEEDGKTIRGILVASEFDKKAISAARVVPNLILRRYSVKFMFSDI